MSILITGAGGYVGQELASALLASSPDTTVILADVVTPSLPASASQHASRARCIQADLTSPSIVDSLFTPETRYETIYLLHGIMSSGAEANFELGVKVNLDSSRYILERLRKVQPGVKVVFTSSLAVYGLAPKGFVIDETNFPPVPSSSYGTQKLIIELLVNDYSRKGFIDGRAVRLPTVTVRAGAPTQAASSFASGIIREPFHGEKAILPVSRDVEMWVSSPYTVVRNLIHAATVPAEAWGDSRSVNLPGLVVTVQEMLDALEAVGGKERRALVEEKYDADIDAIVQTWSPHFDPKRALALGFKQDIPFIENVKRILEGRRPRPTPAQGISPLEIDLLSKGRRTQTRTSYYRTSPHSNKHLSNQQNPNKRDPALHTIRFALSQRYNPQISTQTKLEVDSKRVTNEVSIEHVEWRKMVLGNTLQRTESADADGEHGHKVGFIRFDHYNAVCAVTLLFTENEKTQWGEEPYQPPYAYSATHAELLIG
ncbi:hypothetical protein BJX70DRAFT_404567 [Aspergillus crustosus]